MDWPTEECHTGIMTGLGALIDYSRNQVFIYVIKVLHLTIISQMKKSLLLSLFLSVVLSGKAQNGAVLVMNGGYINIENGAQLVIDNPVDTAIKRTLAGGHIISEHENDVIRWNIGNRNGDYFIPFGVGISDYIPLRFTTYGGVGNGYFELATYGGPDYLNSSYLPAGLTNFTGFSANDNSPYVMDRFWKIKARDYASSNAGRPDFHFLSLSYRDTEHTNIGNIINEGSVFIQRYNPILDSWYDYIPAAGAVTTNVVNNTVSVNVVPNDEIFDWWAIVDAISPLPVELLSFDAKPVDNKAVVIEWTTVSERNLDKFIVERSMDGVSWEFVLQTAALGDSRSLAEYQGVDAAPYTGQSYYRLKQIDLDGTYSYSSIKAVYIEDATRMLTLIYPNPAQGVLNVHFSDELTPKSLVVYDVQGKLVISRDIRSETANTVPLDISRLAQGSYLIQIVTDEQETETYKFVKL